jgi:hypothetical protein
MVLTLCDSEAWGWGVGRLGAGGWERETRRHQGIQWSGLGRPVAASVPVNGLYSLLCPQWSQAAPTTEGEQKSHEGESHAL